MEISMRFWNGSWGSPRIVGKIRAKVRRVSGQRCVYLDFSRVRNLGVDLFRELVDGFSEDRVRVVRVPRGIYEALSEGDPLRERIPPPPPGKKTP